MKLYIIVLNMHHASMTQTWSFVDMIIDKPKKKLHVSQKSQRKTKYDKQNIKITYILKRQWYSTETNRHHMHMF